MEHKGELRSVQLQELRSRIDRLLARPNVARALAWRDRWSLNSLRPPLLGDARTLFSAMREYLNLHRPATKPLQILSAMR